jgi:transcriptional regulator with XRE-family HTH domain
MKAYGYDFHQTMIAKIEAAQRPLRVRELADFAALYGVEVQDLVYPPTASPAETDQEIAEVTATLEAVKARAADAQRQLLAATETMERAKITYEACAADAAVLEGRLGSLQAERQRLSRWESDKYPSSAERGDQAERDSFEPVRSSTGGSGGGATVTRILLGSQLRRLRERQQITPEDAGYAIRASRSKIHRLELGRVVFKERDVADLLTLYGVTDEQERHALLELTRQSSSPRWWHDYSDVLPQWFHAYVGMEEAATNIRIYEAQFIPGLLQTEDYARAVILLGHENASTREIERLVRLRMGRQALFDRPDPPTVQAVIDEAVLRRHIGDPAVMKGQITHLAELAQRANVIIQIIPFQADQHAVTSGPFSILRFAEPDLPDFVYLEQLSSAMYLDRPEDVDSYLTVMERTCTGALTAHESTQFLRRLLKQPELA